MPVMKNYTHNCTQSICNLFNENSVCKHIYFSTHPYKHTYVYSETDCLCGYQIFIISCNPIIFLPPLTNNINTRVFFPFYC